MIDVYDNNEADFALLPVEDNNNELNTASYDFFDLIDNNIKTMIAIDGSEVIFKLNDIGEVATIALRDGVLQEVSRENLPKEIREISTQEHLNKYLENSFIKLSKLSDGEIKVDVEQQLLGGGKKKLTDLPEKYSLPKNYTTDKIPMTNSHTISKPPTTQVSLTGYGINSGIHDVNLVTNHSLSNKLTISGQVGVNNLPNELYGPPKKSTTFGVGMRFHF